MQAAVGKDDAATSKRLLSALKVRSTTVVEAISRPPRL
jgi:hypothetical protein